MDAALCLAAAAQAQSPAHVLEASREPGSTLGHLHQNPFVQPFLLCQLHLLWALLPLLMARNWEGSIGSSQLHASQLVTQLQACLSILYKCDVVHGHLAAASEELYSALTTSGAGLECLVQQPQVQLQPMFLVHGSV
jgi:ATP/maltotriose-dependent transcriptional regulator MalT